MKEMQVTLGLGYFEPRCGEPSRSLRLRSSEGRRRLPPRLCPAARCGTEPPSARGTLLTPLGSQGRRDHTAGAGPSASPRDGFGCRSQGRAGGSTSSIPGATEEEGVLPIEYITTQFALDRGVLPTRRIQ